MEAAGDVRADTDEGGDERFVVGEQEGVVGDIAVLPGDDAQEVGVSKRDRGRDSEGVAQGGRGDDARMIGFAREAFEGLEVRGDVGAQVAGGVAEGRKTGEVKEFDGRVERTEERSRRWGVGEEADAARAGRGGAR